MAILSYNVYRGFAAIMKNMKGLKILAGGIPFVEALEYQAEINKVWLEPPKKLKIEDFQVNNLS